MDRRIVSISEKAPRNRTDPPAQPGPGPGRLVPPETNHRIIHNDP